MTALEIELPGDRVERVIVRCPGEAAMLENPRAAAEEFRLLEILHAQGLPVPAPRLLDLSGNILSAPYLVLDFMDGQPGFSLPVPDRSIQQLGDTLARIHRASSSGVDLSFLNNRDPGRFMQSLAGPPAVLNESLFEGRIRAALQGAHARSRSPVSLLHGDYWPGNILWQDGRLAAVVDWEDAALGDPLADLAITRLDLLWIFGRPAMTAFTAHYLSLAGLDAGDLPYWDLHAALRLVRLAGSDLPGWASFFIAYGRADISEAAIRRGYNFFIDQAFAKLLTR